MRVKKVKQTDFAHFLLGHCAEFATLLGLKMTSV